LISKKFYNQFVARDCNLNSSLSLPPQPYLTNLDRGAKMISKETIKNRIARGMTPEQGYD